MSRCCVDQLDTCLVRGDNYALDVGLSEGFEEVSANPELYEGRMVFRDEQDDALPDLLVLTSEVIPPTDPVPGMAAVEMFFRATPDQTQALPWYDIVHFVEVRALTGTEVKRLFQGKAKVND